jgi:hypothetical protein
MTAPSRLLFAGLITVSFSSAIEIATGKMLGEGYDRRAFYIRSGGGDWEKTYSGSAYRPDATGRLMNIRIAQALFHDEWLTEEEFDPEAHTERIIRALDGYRAHGILAISVSLQGGNMAYERTANIRRSRDYKLGPGKGAHVSAFRPDGSLKKEWMNRALRLARELDRRGMILDLQYLYAHQDELFESPAAIERAVANATDWLIDNKLHNVIIEIANEYDLNAWDHDRFVFRNMAKLIEIAGSRFDAKHAGYRLPVTASTTRVQFYESGRGADLTAVHGNGLTAPQKGDRVRALMKDPDVPGPLYMNEDDNGRETTLHNLTNELASCDEVWRAGGSWGYMPWVQLQIYPFRDIEPGGITHVSDDMPVGQRNAAYFKAVLVHIRNLVFAPQ